MKQGKGILTKHARYVATMAALLADRAERYEGAIDNQIEDSGVGCAYCGYDVDQTCSGTNIERMIVQLRAELLELGKMIEGTR